MPRQSPDDSGHVHQYGKRPCPRCGKLVTTCAWGFHAHLAACLRREIVFEGRVVPAVPEDEMPARYKR